MPGFTTHYLMGQKLRCYLHDEKLNQIIDRNKNAFDAGLQGPDLFFYNLIFAAGPVSHNVGKQMHEHHTGAFFLHFLTLAEKEEKRKDREIAIAYFLGFLSHYTLDTIIHPYVYARCRVSGSKPVSENEAFSKHTLLESIIDVCLLKKEKGLSPSVFHQTKTLSLTKREQNTISRLMTKTIKHLYGLSPWYLFSYHSMKLGTLLLHDQTGLKRKAAHFLEKNVFHLTMVSNMIQTDDYQDTMDACNLSHRLYANPWFPERKSAHSVYDMIEDSCLMYGYYTDSIASYLLSLSFGLPDSEQKKLGFSKIGTLSYHNGMPCL